jgi:hypothetical protein
VLLLVLSACSAGKRETASLAAAVDRFHQAPNTAEPAAADFLATVPCTDKEVCEAKDACVKATSATAKALRLMSEAEQGVADLKSGKLTAADPAAQELPVKLQSATDLLAEGHDGMPACDSKVAKLRAQYGI